MTWEAIHGSNKKCLQKIPINRATKNFIPLQIMQPISVIWKYLINFEGSNPEGFKFTIISLIMFGCIPFEYQISWLEILFTGLSFKILLDPLMVVMFFFHHLLSSLLEFYQLMNSFDHIVKLSLAVLKEFFYMQGKVRRKNGFSPIHKLRRRDTQSSLCCNSINPQRKFEL